MRKIIGFIKRIFNKNYNFDRLTREEFKTVVDKIILKIKESDNELF